MLTYTFQFMQTREGNALCVVAGAAIRHSRLSLYDAIRTLTTTGIALPCQGSVTGLTGMPSHTQSDFRCADTKKPKEFNLGLEFFCLGTIERIPSVRDKSNQFFRK
ncbi:hypothetical protein ACMGNR_001144 [Citrobacter koseri]|nr:hypothetical protein [Citrobacter koseri]EKU8895001.1 hypothetical protein [Citrobacter koseri]ELG4627382.1 hypothetical protein [Citrobacter koseri]HEM8525095.1 hypothetical protein [Citrobacter koseri]